MTDYYTIIKTKYPNARGSMEEGCNFELMSIPNEAGEYHTFISLWLLPDPQPTMEELDEYAASPEFLAAWGARLKAEAEAQTNAWANAKVIEFKILIDELFYVAMIANIGFLSQKWVRYGRPTELDPLEFVCIHSESQAYRDSHVGLNDAESQMTAYQLAGVQEAKWQDMQNGFAGIVYARRLALEQIKLAPITEGLESLLSDIVAGLDLTLGQTMQNLAAQQAQLLAAREEV
ncbi:MAG: hypothetical protein KJ077_50410 [Anaerolineae bacterium]|nr:hypothetical protein [Anaerolineae bacterium]